MAVVFEERLGLRLLRRFDPNIHLRFPARQREEATGTRVDLIRRSFFPFLFHFDFIHSVAFFSRGVGTLSPTRPARLAL